MKEENTLLFLGCNTEQTDVLHLTHHCEHPDDKLYIEVADNEFEDGHMVEMTRKDAMRLAGAIRGYYANLDEPG